MKNANYQTNPAATDGRRTQEERRKRTRIKLIQSTVSCIDRVGLGSLKVADIAGEAGVTSGAVQHLFGNRENLIIESVKFVFSRYSGSHKALNREGSIRDRLLNLKALRLKQTDAAGYRAFIELMCFSRTNHSVGRVIRKSLKEMSKSYEAWFTWYLSDLGIPHDTLVKAKNLLVSDYYGVVLVNVYQEDPEYIKSVLDLSFELLINYLESQSAEH